MALDYGTKRVGIAVSDPQQIIATALTTIHSSELFDFLQQYMQQEPVETIVVGFPLQVNGQVSESAQHVVGIIRRLKKTFPAVVIKRIDERYTSKMASAAIAQSGLNKKARQDKGRIDRMSAVILLQDYMQRIQNL